MLRLLIRTLYLTLTWWRAVWPVVISKIWAGPRWTKRDLFAVSLWKGILTPQMGWSTPHPSRTMLTGTLGTRKRRFVNPKLSSDHNLQALAHDSAAPTLCKTGPKFPILGPQERLIRSENLQAPVTLVGPILFPSCDPVSNHRICRWPKTVIFWYLWCLGLDYFFDKICFHVWQCGSY